FTELEIIVETFVLHVEIRNPKSSITQFGKKLSRSGSKEVRILKTNCEDFLEMQLRYQHLSPLSPDTDYIPIQMEIRDKKSQCPLQTENVWIPVGIKGAILTQFYYPSSSETLKHRLILEMHPELELLIRTSLKFEKMVMIHIMLVKDQLPEEFPWTISQLVVKETEIVHITKNRLHFTDTRSPENQLMYMVTKSCFSPSSLGIIYDAVKLIFIDSMKSYKKDPAISMLTSFTQHAVTHLKVAYMPPERESGPDPLFVFEFSVSDQQGGVVAGLNFNIAVMPVANEAPEIFTNHLTEEGASFFISGENLMVSDLDTRDDLRIRLKKCPQYGHIEQYGLIMQEGDMFTLEDLQSYKVRYQPDDSETLEDVVIFSATDGFNTADGVLRGQVITNSAISLPVNDKPPELQAGLKSRLECLEGGYVITTEYLYATDADSEDTKLTYMLAHPPAPGVIQKRGFMLDKFSQLDVTQRLITYVHTGGEIGHSLCDDSLTLIVSDGEVGTVDSCFFNKALPPPLSLHTSLPVCDLNITVLPITNQRPTIHLVSVSLPRTPRSWIDIKWSLWQRCQLVQGAGLSSPYQDLQIHSFSLAELKQGLMLVYMHDDTESLEDSFTMQLTDGKHTVQGTLYIYIMPVNDEIPHLSRNTGLEVEIDEHKVISSVALEAEDKDSPRDKLHYIVNSMQKLGDLKLKAMSSWTTLYPGMNFTREDVDMSLLWYFHTNILGLKSYDCFQFYVTDGENSCPLESFYISIRNVGKGDIVLLTKPVTLTEGDRVTLTTDVLMATDGTSKPEKLLYAISVPPVHGQIEYINYPGMPISSYSQLDVVAQKVCYVHDNSHEASKDSFRNVISKAEELCKHYPLYANFNFHSDVLQLTDLDRPLKNLNYIITKHPHYGHLCMTETVLYWGQFTQMDINNMEACYRHNGGAGQIDRFSFVATDKVNHGFLVNGQMRKEAIEFVKQHDKISPTLQLKESPTTIQNLKDDRLGILTTACNLKVTDVDNKDEDLTFKARRPPFFGHLENSKTGSYVLSTFTQNDLNLKIIRYIINPSTEVTSDSFEFQVSDVAGNTMVPVVLEMKWSRVELVETCYRVCENVGTVAIKVVRTGQSAEPLFVGIRVQDVSARVSLDFTCSTERLVQFDPGAAFISFLSS
ncbi:LOW QUALITY PROTEIN: FRAS1-related extracellular matrix protein 1-like, partial [Pangshura tecta]